MAQTIDRKALANIMNGRTLVPASKVGRTVTLTVQGNGNIVDVKNKEGQEVESYIGGGAIFQKKIFNCKANSEVAMQAAPNRELLKSALAEDKAGNADKAAELFGQYLNKVQLSFNIPLPSPIADKIGDRDEISAKVTMITTDNGSILTLDPKSIKVLEPEVLGNTKFSLPDEDETEEEEAPVNAEEALNEA